MEAGRCEHAAYVDLLPGDLLVKQENHHARTVSAIKIDVEGHELDVLAGLKNTILEHRPTIFFELTVDTRDVLQVFNDLLPRYELFSFEMRGWTKHVPRLIRLALHMVAGRRYSLEPLREVEIRQYQCVVAVPVATETPPLPSSWGRGEAG